MMLFPSQISEISLQWLNQLFIQCGIQTTENILSFEVKPVAEPGMTSTAHILILKYDQKPPKAPEKVIAKFSLDSEPVKEALSVNRGFEREVFFYQKYGQDTGIPTPKCYWAEYDSKSNSCGILLEYIDNTRTTDQLSGDIQEIKSVITYLASFHAKWWGRDQDLVGLYPGQAPFIVDLFVNKLTISLENIKKNYSAEVGEDLISLLELWLPNAYRFVEHEQSKVQTLCHGDLHRNQVLFPQDTSGIPYVIDWQLTALDTGPTDLARWIVSGLRPELRQQCESELIEYYYTELVRHGVLNYSLDDLWGSYRQGIARFALFNLTSFSVGDITPIIAWWESDPKRGRFWDITCNWPGLALAEHGVIKYLEEILLKLK